VLKKLVAVVLAVTFSTVWSVAPIFAGEGPMPASQPVGVTSGPPVVTAGSTGDSGWSMAGGPRDKNPTLAGIMSAILPCTGQWYNGELWTWKSGAMAAIEAGSIFVLAFFAAGGAGDDAKMVCMAGAGGMIANHAWSGWDAWRSAKRISGLALEMDKNRTMVSYNIPF